MFTGLDATNKIYKVKHNEVLLHIILNGWDKQKFLQGFYFEALSFKKVLNMFERIDIAESIH